MADNRDPKVRKVMAVFASQVSQGEQAEALAQLNPAAQAAVLVELEADARATVVGWLSPAARAAVLPYLNPAQWATTLYHLSPTDWQRTMAAFVRQAAGRERLALPNPWEGFGVVVEEWRRDFESIPEIPKLYTRLLAEICAGQRIHRQSTFGPENDPEMGICNTPMCTAGHLVNMAGRVGYMLRRKYGWAKAATMIHVKNRPDVPPQDFGDILQPYAMAYIEQRASEENNENEEEKIKNE